MQCFYCGFLDREEGSSLQLLQAPSGSAVVCVALVPGGWGRAAVMNSNGQMVLWGAIADNSQLPHIGEQQLQQTGEFGACRTLGLGCLQERAPPWQH